MHVVLFDLKVRHETRVLPCRVDLILNAYVGEQLTAVDVDDKDGLGGRQGFHRDDLGLNVHAQDRGGHFFRAVIVQLDHSGKVTIAGDVDDACALRECFLSSRVRLENDQIRPNLPD